MIDFDVETRHLAWYLPDAGGLHRASFGHEGLAPSLYMHPDQRQHAQASLLENDDYRGWHTKFDLHMLKANGYELPPESAWHDGMVAAHLVDERFSAALQARGDKLFGPEEAGAATEEAVKGWILAEDARRRKVSKETGEQMIRTTYGDVPAEIMDLYALHDITLTQSVSGVYYPALEAEPELMELYEVEMRVMRGLFAMEDRGIPFDRDALARLEAELLPAIDAAEDKCRRIAGRKDFNVRSPQQVGKALEELGADIRFMSRDSKTKQLKVDEENLEACDHPLADAVLGYRGVHKLYAMVRAILHGPTGKNEQLFPGPYLTGDDMVHPNFRQMGARTGRLSCSNPNFQQINRDDLRLRYAVRAQEGKKLVTCDLDSIELVLLAAFAGNGAMKDMLVNGEDPHVHTAQMTGLTGRRRSTGAIESARDQGKRMNYLTVYGGGQRAMKKFFGIPSAEAQRVQKAYFAAYPEILDLQTRIEIALEDKGFIKTPFGRRQRAYSRNTAYREAYKFVNYLIQGTAADMMKHAIARVHEAGVPMVATVHDELIAHVDEGDAEEAAQVIQEAMTDFPTISELVPVTAEAQIVDRWSDAKTKPGNEHFRPAYMD